VSLPSARFEADGDPDVARVLEVARDVLMRHPIAVQAAFAALVAEGKRFAATPEGAIWESRLARSELLSRLRVIWESLSMTAFTEHANEALPSFFLDGLVRAAAERGLETLLSSAFDDVV
jgi:hypothetical protein